MRKATLIFDQKFRFPDSAILEIRIWLVPAPVPPSTHAYKYSLFYGARGERIVGYDNERGKGDHRHYREQELSYMFVSIERLLSDFRADVEAVRRGKR